MTGFTLYLATPSPTLKGVKRYFVELTAGDPQGPFSKKEIAEALGSGRWTYDVSVCVEGGSIWKRLDAVRALRSLVPGRSGWLLALTVLCALSALGDFAVAVLVALAIALASKVHRPITTPEVGLLLGSLFVALRWTWIGWGIYRRRTSAYRRAVQWTLISIACHALYAFAHTCAALPLPFDALTLLLLFLARRDFRAA